MNMMEEHSNVLTQRDETIIRAMATLQKASKKAERLISDYHPILCSIASPTLSVRS